MLWLWLCDVWLAVELLTEALEASETTLLLLNDFDLLSLSPMDALALTLAMADAAS